MSIIRGLFLAAVIAFSFGASALKTKVKQINALEAQLAELETHYGMAKFKAKHFGVTTDELRKKYTRLIKEARTLDELEGLVAPVQREILSPDEFRQLMIGMIAELRDGHVNNHRLSSDAATLGLVAANIGERLYVTSIREPFILSDSSTTKIQVGDEILELDGVPVQEIAKRNMLYAQGGTHANRWNHAMGSVVNRFSAINLMPKEGDAVTLKLARDGREYMAHLRWVYTGDYLLLAQQFPKHIEPPYIKAAAEDVPVPYGFSGMVRSYFRTGLMNLPNMDASVIDIGQALNAEIQKIHQEAKTNPGVADPHGLQKMQPVSRLPLYIVRHQDKNIGVFRIPSYSPQPKLEGLVNEYRWIAEGLRRLESLSDVLVIDQLSNAGGMVYYVSRLLSLFANQEQPLKTASADHRLNETLLNLWKPSFGTEPLYGEKPNYADMRFSEQAYRDLKKKLADGEEWTGPISGFDNLQYGLPNEVGEVFTAREGVYTRPILLLNDRFSASGGDFFPAFLQENKRAKVMGETSCGLGGPVYRNLDSIPGSEMSFRCTSAYAELDNGWPIENIGVVPDIYRPIAVSDLRDGFRTWARDVLSAAVAVSNGANPEVAPVLKPVTGSETRDQIAQLVSELDLTSNVKYRLTIQRLIAMRAQSETSEWEGVMIPLPDSLRKDIILSTLWQRLEVIERLKDLKRLPDFKKSGSLIDDLISLAEQLPASSAFANPCELALGMTPLK